MKRIVETKATNYCFSCYSLYFFVFYKNNAYNARLILYGAPNFSFNIKAKLTSLTSDVFNHSAHTMLSTASAGLAFGMVGAVAGLGIGLVESTLLYNNIIDTPYLT